MGWAERANAALRASLAGLKVAVDVQHIYRPAKPGDHGSLYVLANGGKVWEASAATTYATSLVHTLTDRGAAVLTNDPARGVLVGPYSRRNQEASTWAAHLYLACHVNAGGGAYCLTEYMVGTPGQPAGDAIGKAIVAAFPQLQGARCNPLVRGQRGAVCIEGFTRTRAALVLEPFFGDNPRCQDMLAGPALVELGQMIAAGIATWWAGQPKK